MTWPSYPGHAAPLCSSFVVCTEDTIFIGVENMGTVMFILEAQLLPGSNNVSWADFSGMLMSTWIDEEGGWKRDGVLHVVRLAITPPAV